MTTPEQQIGALQADMDNVKDDVAEIRKDVREMRDIVLTVRGSWKTLVILGGVSAAVGALIAKITPYLPFLPK